MTNKEARKFLLDVLDEWDDVYSDEAHTKFADKFLSEYDLKSSNTEEDCDNCIHNYCDINQDPCATCTLGVKPTNNWQPKKMPVLKDRLWYKCATCGNKGLSESPDEKHDKCGGCDSPDFKLMKHQQSWIVGKEDYIHPEGTI